jgi:hypothetical protein
MVKTGQGTARLWGGMTDATTLPMLGAHAMLGRTLVEGDESNPNVVVLCFCLATASHGSYGIRCWTRCDRTRVSSGCWPVFRPRTRPRAVSNPDSRRPA